jgi:maltose O-acetyltransferase
MKDVSQDTRPGKIRRILREELGGLHLRWRVVHTAGRILPDGLFLRLRTRLYRLGGLHIGPGTVISGKLHLSGFGHPGHCLRIGANCYLNDRIAFNLEDEVVLEDGVSVGMECLFLTVSHAIGGPAFRAGQTQASPVRVERGAWLGARVTVLPGVTIGAGAVIGAGALVTRSIPPNTLAAGVPARVLRNLESP